jgi:hypothetical protein
MKEEKVLTILNTREATFRGKDVTEYSILVRRSAYESMMDRLRANYTHKDVVLEYIFEDDDTIEASLMIDPKTGKVAGLKQSVSNPCVEFLLTLDEAAGEDLPARVDVESYYKPGTDVADAVEPANHVTIESIYDAIMADYEAEAVEE